MAADNRHVPPKILHVQGVRRGQLRASSLEGVSDIQGDEGFIL